MKFGFAFPEVVSTEKRKHHRAEKDGEHANALRGILLPLLLFLCILLLFAKLFYLQILKGKYYLLLSDTNRTRTQTIHAPRGIIFDRNGAPLVFNIPGFRKQEMGKTRLLKREEALRRVAKGEKGLEVDSLRQYPFGEDLAHIVGYIGQISEEELKSGEYLEKRPGDVIGKMGIEKQYEASLAGTDGKHLVEVDSNGKILRTLGQTDPIPGKDITLTIDGDLQRGAGKALKDIKKGVVIVSNLEGEILAMVSKPSFDPNLFTLGESYKTATDASYPTLPSVLLDSKNQPLLNRAISGVYPPGSTFKLITAAAGLEEKKIDKTSAIADTGVIKVGTFSFANWFFTQYGKTEGDVNVVKAISRSNDIFFYKLAEMVGVDNLSKMADKFSVGKKLGVDIPEEATGLLPTSTWKKEVIGEAWYLGDTYHFGIGQGYLLTTPLQVNMWTQVIANGGLLYEPHLLKNQKSKIKNQKFLKENTTSIIREGMIHSCSPGGVGWPLFEFRVKNSELRIDGKDILEAPQASQSAENIKDYRKITIACKTGTAQHGDEKTLPHAWITLFAPAYSPQIVVTVLAESSGEGSSVAAPVAKKVLEEWFGRK